MRYAILLSCFTILFLASTVSPESQSRPYKGPDDPAGDVQWRREAYMDANRVKLEFKNTTELADWPDPDSHKWQIRF